MNKKRILIIGINSIPELTGIGRYTVDMLNWMVEHGHEVTMVTAYPYYPYWKVQAPYNGNVYRKESLCDGHLSIYRCPFYVPANPTGAKRILHEASFHISAFFVICRLLFKPKFDVTFTIAPPFHLGFLALFYRFFKGTPIVYHIQDLQIDAAKELNMLKPKWLLNLFFGIEKFILNSVDTVSTISEGMKKKIQVRRKGEIMMFPNWVDTTNYYPVSESWNLKSRWGFSPSDKLVLYSGSIGEKQGLDSLIRIANELREVREIKFVICGTGPFKSKLQQMAQDLNLTNVYFLPLQENDVFNDFLNIGDVHLVLQKGDASDLVMPSKLTTILAVGGLALVTASPGTTLHEVITDHEMGVVVKPGNEVWLKEAIQMCCRQDFSKERTNARRYAEFYLNKNTILDEMIHHI